jgi:flagellar hook-associated protein 3 FlgL
MISSLNPQSQRFLADLARVQERIDTASRQISSGKRVNVPSDAPDMISELLQLRATLQRNTQITANLSVAQADANVSESALSSATQLMDRAVTLASQGATGTMDATGRLSLANEVQSIQEQIVSYSQTQSAGRFVFSGDQETVPAYRMDLTNANFGVDANGNINGDGTGTGAGVDRLINPMSSTRVVENPIGGTFPVSQTAQQIFDNRNPDDTLAPDNVFAALNSLRTALLNNNASAVNTSIASLKQASDHLNTSLAFYGTVQNRIQSAANSGANYDLQIRTQMSQKEDADVVAASLELSQGTTQLQASFQMEGRIPRTSLFDFLTP